MMNSHEREWGNLILSKSSIEPPFKISFQAVLGKPLPKTKEDTQKNKAPKIITTLKELEELEKKDRKHK